MVWETDLGVTFIDGVWVEILRRVHKSSVCARQSCMQCQALRWAHYIKQHLHKCLTLCLILWQMPTRHCKVCAHSLELSLIENILVWSVCYTAHGSWTRYCPHALLTLVVVWPSQSVFPTAKRFNYIFNPQGQEVNSVEMEIHSSTHLYHLDQRVILFSVFCISCLLYFLY